MKTYLKELRGQVRGNARLRRRLAAKDDEIRRLRGHLRNLATSLDKLGHGDDFEVVVAASAAGWTRYSQEMREQIEKVFGVKP